MKTSKLFITSLLAAAAMSATAYAEEVALTNGQQTTLTVSSGVAGAGNTYTYTAPEEGTTDNGGWLWLGDLQGTGNVALGSAESNMALSGSGLVVLGYQGGNYGTTYNFDFTNTAAAAFSGKFAVVNEWNNSTVAKLSGTGWSNVEYVFAGVSREQNWVTKRMYNDTSRGYDTLALQGATTLAGITGTSKGYVPTGAGVAAGIGNINLREAVTVATSGTVLTLAGAGTYEFYGKVGTASEKVGIAKTGTGTQVLGGTLYLGAVTVSGGTLDLSGANVTLASAIANSGTVSVNANTIFVLSDSLKVGDTGNTYSLISGGTIEGWNTTTLSAVNFVLSGASSSQRGATVVLTEAGSVTYTAGSGEAANLTWKAGVSGTWDVQTTRSWTNDSTSADDVFYDYDNVKFDTTGDVTVAIAAGGVTADTVTISAGTVSFTTNKVTAQSGFVVENGATLKLKANNNLGGKVTVKTGGVLDVNGNQTDLSKNGLTEVILAGGKLANNYSTSVDTNSQQLWKITLTEDSSVGGVQSNGSSGGNFGLVGSGHGATTLDLGGYKLTKQDRGIFYLVNTTITAGTFEIAGGTVQLAQRPSDGSAADFVLSGGSLDLNGKNLSAKSVSGTSGTITLGAGTLTVGTGVTEESVKTFSGRVDGGSGTLTKAGSGTIVFSGNTTIGTLNVTGGTATFTTDASVNKITGSTGTLKIESGTVTMGSSGSQRTLGMNIEIGGVSDGNGGYETAKLTGGFTDQFIEEGSRTIAVKGGGELQLGKVSNPGAYGIRWAIVGGTTNRTSISLSNGGVISGLGDKYGALDFMAANTVTATGTGNTISAAVRLRTGEVTFNVAENSDLTISGTLQKMTSGRDTTDTTDNASGTLSKSGSGKLVLSGDNSKYGRAINVTEGTLVAAHAKALGTGTVTVSNGAKLGIKVASAVTAGTVTFNEGAKFLIDLTDVSVEENTALTIISSSAISFNSIETGSLTSEIIESYFDAGNSVLGDYSTWLREWSYDGSTLSLTMTIPEPSTFGLLAGAGALALVAARRRRQKKA